MSVYILPDTSEATVHAEFIVRAGYIHQNEKNAGFIPLYAKVFSETIKNSQWLNSYGVTFSYECSDMATKYAFTFPPQVLDVVLENLAMQIFEPVYTDSAILESYIQTKEDSKNIASAVTGFINRQIESTILKISPYQQKASWPQGLENKTSITQIRQALDKIAKAFYIPRNCALFLTGAVDKKITQEKIQPVFENYQSKRKIPQKSEFTIKNKSESKKYVLVSSDFSEELNHLVLQYPATDFEQNFSIDWILNFLTADSDYVNYSSVSHGMHQRLVIQELTDSKSSGINQIENLISTVTKFYRK